MFVQILASRSSVNLFASVLKDNPTTIPSFAIKMVLSFSSLRRDDGSDYHYSIADDVTSFDEMID